MISLQTAMDIAFMYREIEVSEKMLSEIESMKKNNNFKDIRDVFGRVPSGLELGIPSGDSSKRLFHVQWNLAKPVIEAHIANCKSQLSALMEKSKSELSIKPDEGLIKALQEIALNTHFRDVGEIPKPIRDFCLDALEAYHLKKAYTDIKEQKVL